MFQTLVAEENETHVTVNMLFWYILQILR